MEYEARITYHLPMLRDSHAVAGQDAPAQGASKRRGAGNKTRANAVLDRPTAPQGWNTTDDEEIELRRWRGRTEISEAEPLESNHLLFGTFRVRSESGTPYEVEIRSLQVPINSCGCIDHRVNGLGICKHIEGVIEVLSRQRSATINEADLSESARVEIFIDRRHAPRPAITFPGRRGATRAAHGWLEPFLSADGSLKPDPSRVAALLQAWSSAAPRLRRQVRISRHIGPWLDREQRLRSRTKARTKFLADVERGKASFDLTRLPLLPYQRDGMLHLAFSERALLADEMGLGKTLQAIAAAELLARRKAVRRVLVVCPASLKAEWEEQIARFTDRPARSVFGSRPQRLAAYRDPSFFNIVNYEQVLADADDINEVLAPDIVILDEAQRIKNWQTKTARRVKSLRSPFAFVLTGTPIENRIDELYSIVQYLDPEVFGPLFRFNREFYALDERGRPVDYKNLAELRHRVAPVMLRRRKADVESELPGRTVTNYFVTMADEQRARYEEYKTKAARLLALAQRRPLRPEEFERLQQWLACMRMICDTPAILDPTCRISPKLEELERILADLLAEPTAKVIVFAEWERMLDMVRELAGEMGVEAAWHTGSVPQQRRRAEINRFKLDPRCRLFLSTDSGSVGLNLQVANAVVNVDLPWNPAKLEQRIARAWRKGQMRPVTVVNLIAENSIEHGMLHLLGAKQALADGVLDGQGDLAAIKMPSGRAAMIERMQALMSAGDKHRAALPLMVPPEAVIAADIRQRHGERALLIEARQGSDGRMHMLAVLEVDLGRVASEAKRSAAAGGDALAIEVIDRATWDLLQRLQASGLVQFTGGAARVLHQSASLSEHDGAAARIIAARATELLGTADRQLRKAQVLSAGGFPEEVAPLLASAITHAAAARLVGNGELPPEAGAATPEQIRDLVEREELPRIALSILALPAPEALTAAKTNADVADLEPLLKATAKIVAACGGAAN